MPVAQFVITMTAAGADKMTRPQLDAVLDSIEGAAAAYTGTGEVKWWLTKTPDAVQKIVGAVPVERVLTAVIHLDVTYAEGDDQATIIPVGQPIYDAAVANPGLDVTDHYWTGLPVNQSSRVDKPYA